MKSPSFFFWKKKLKFHYQSRSWQKCKTLYRAQMCSVLSQCFSPLIEKAGRNSVFIRSLNDTTISYWSKCQCWSCIISYCYCLFNIFESTQVVHTEMHISNYFRPTKKKYENKWSNDNSKTNIHLFIGLSNGIDIFVIMNLLRRKWRCHCLYRVPYLSLKPNHFRSICVRTPYPHAYHTHTHIHFT